MEEDASCHVKRQFPGRRPVGRAIGQRHHQGCQDEVQRVVEAEDERHGNHGSLAERQQRKARPHIADIAVGRRKPHDRRLVDPAACADQRDDEHQREHRISRKRGRDDEPPLGELFDRRLGQQVEENSAGSADIDDEAVHPAERLDRLARDAGGDEPQRDQPEERQNQADNACHALPTRPACCQPPCRPADSGPAPARSRP